MAAPAEMRGNIGLQEGLPSPIPPLARALVTALAQLLLLRLYIDPSKFSIDATIFRSCSGVVFNEPLAKLVMRGSLLAGLGIIEGRGRPFLA